MVFFIEPAIRNTQARNTHSVILERGEKTTACSTISGTSDILLVQGRSHGHICLGQDRDLATDIVWSVSFEADAEAFGGSIEAEHHTYIPYLDVCKNQPASVLISVS